MNNNLWAQDASEMLSAESVTKIIVQKWKHILYITLFSTIIAVLIAYFLVPAKYTANVTLYVSNVAQTGENGSINISDINASQSLVRTCLVLIKSRSVLEQVEETLKRQDYDIERLERVIKCKSVEGTEILEILVETTEPELSKQIAQKIGEIVPVEMQRVFQAGSAIVVDSARLPEKKSSPKIPTVMIVSSWSSILISALYFVTVGVLDQSVKGQEDFEKYYNIPVLGILTATMKELPSEINIPGPWDVASESEMEEYKVLRTNLMFGLSQKMYKRIVFCGVDSVQSKESVKLSFNPAKKLKRKDMNHRKAIAVNCAIVLAQTGAKVVLIDANLRNPSVHRILQITKKQQGLSTILTSDNLPEDLRYTMEETEYPNLKVICSGPMPPNLIELFESRKVLRMFELLEREFEYIIIDSPDVNNHSDALVLSKHQCSIVLTVQEKQSDHRQIKKALKSIELVEGSVPGAVISS